MDDEVLARREEPALSGQASAKAALNRVRQGVVLAGEMPHAAAAERRAERRVVHRDDGAQPRLGLVADHDLLVLVEEPQSAASIASR